MGGAEEGRRKGGRSELIRALNKLLSYFARFVRFALLLMILLRAVYSSSSVCESPPPPSPMED